MKDNRRFKNRVIYQIYPMSFCDSNNDGYGDINGIISKLDYLKDLGVGMLWLSPIYLSDFKDNGYDIIDYYKIHPTFGTMEEFENLIKEADKRDIKIVMDLVINHTSTNHVWFKEALREYIKVSMQGSVHADRYNDKFYRNSLMEKVTNIGNKVGALDSGNFTGSYNKATFSTANYNKQESVQTTSLDDLNDIF